MLYRSRIPNKGGTITTRIKPILKPFRGLFAAFHHFLYPATNKALNVYFEGFLKPFIYLLRHCLILAFGV